MMYVLVALYGGMTASAWWIAILYFPPIAILAVILSLLGIAVLATAAFREIEKKEAHHAPK